MAGHSCGVGLEALAVLTRSEVGSDPSPINSGELGVDGGRNGFAHGVARYRPSPPSSTRLRPAPHDDDPNSSFTGST